MKISLVIPAFKEEAVIEKTLTQYYNYFSKNVKSFEIIVVFDGKDRTGEIAKEFSKKHKNVNVLEFENRLGKGGALIAGFKAANGDMIGFVDADASVSAVGYGKLIAKIKEGYGCAVASRRMPDSNITAKRPFKDSFGSRGWQVLVKILFRLGIEDTQCGGKIWSRTAMDVILPKLTVTNLACDVDLLWQTKKAGFKIKEVGVVWDNDIGNSVSSIRHWPNMLISLLKLFFRK